MLRETVINHSIPWAPAYSSGERGRGLDELLTVYSPFGAIRNVLTSFRSSVGPYGYQGSATPMSLDHQLRRMLGMSGISAGLDRDIYGGGKGLNFGDSVASSLGEAVERMLGSFSSLQTVGSADRMTATAAEMRSAGLNFVGPEEYDSYFDEQLTSPGFLFERWTEETRLVWHRGRNLVTAEDHWVPAQFVHLFYISAPDESRVGSSSSGGLATHVSEAESLAHGLLEVVERDGLNVAWFSKVPLTIVDIDTNFEDPLIDEWLESARRVGLDITFYVHRMDMPEFFVVTAAGIEPGLKSGMYVSGGGVGLRLEDAIRSAIAEVVQAERMARSAQLTPDWELTMGVEKRFGIKPDAELSDFTNFIQVVDYYGYPENQRKLDWFFRNPNSPRIKLSENQPPRSAVPELSDILGLYDKYDLTPIAFDLTPSDFRRVSTTKVFVPELAPAFPPNNPQLGHRRYREIPQKLDLVNRPWTYADMPTDPLPYP
ncbi:YcaO-like family protein [Brevibacterium aurantiacum]